MSKGILAVSTGIDLTKALHIARGLGCQVAFVRRTGEIRVTHPLMAKSCKVNGRRKDCPRHLVGWLRTLSARL